MNAPNFDPDDVEQSQKPTGFEYATKLLLPALSLVAFIVAQFTAKRVVISWLLLGLTVLLLFIGFWQTMWVAATKIWRRWRNYRTIKKILPEFRALVNRFEQFVNPRTNNTVHHIVLHDVFQGRTDQFMKLSLPECSIWHTFWQHLCQRIGARQRDADEFGRSLREFNDLLGLYGSYCVNRIFEHSPQEFQNALTPEAKRSLNSFQQRFSAFLDAYEDFGKKLAGSVPMFENTFFSFWRPRPL